MEFARGAGVEDERAIFPGGGRAVLITHKPTYRALNISGVRHRRGNEATTQVLMRRLLSFDDIIERPSFGSTDSSSTREGARHRTRQRR